MQLSGKVQLCGIVGSDPVLRRFGMGIGLTCCTNNHTLTNQLIAPTEGESMSELIEIDSSGNEQYIWLQERTQSCGPACVYMVERIRQQACPAGGEERIREICRLLPQGYTEKAGTASYTALALALRRIGISGSATYIANFRQFSADCSFPFITRIGWPNGGGHFVVCVGRSTLGQLICLDPWFGLSEPRMDQLPAYCVTRDARRAMCLAIPIGGIFSGHSILL
ncbi:MAG: papain-like cysteine protease family protein [Telluria sp.]